jgi:hypothetical protein
VDALPQGASCAASSVGLENHEKGEEALETPQAGRCSVPRSADTVIRGESSRNDAESQAFMAATLELRDR